MQEQKELLWMRLDLHIHTPASEDYADPSVSYLDILREAERRELSIIAFTDHNTVHGYEQFRTEIEFLQRMAELDRCTTEEEERLAEYLRLLQKVTVLPGFEFTSHYGAHILGIFDPSTPLSVLEAVLLQLGIPSTQIKAGSCAIPNTRHVTEAYEIIYRNGGIVIAPHVNSPTGVVTETLRMNVSGQSRVAATQSPFLHALEFVNFYTSHERFLSPAFYNGTHEHYLRPMFCIQGSDAHMLRKNNGQDTRRQCGVGDRCFEALLPEPSFAALMQLFSSQNLEHVRVPQRDQKQWELDNLHAEGDTQHRLLRVASPEYVEQAWKDVAALANADGGTLVLRLVHAEPSATAVCEMVRAGVVQQLMGDLDLTMETLRYDDHELIRIDIKSPASPPYVSQAGEIFVRRDATTVPAQRDDILQIARRTIAATEFSPLDNGEDLDLPRSGVEIVGEQKRNGIWSYEVRDLRTTTGVERDRAQGLWAYAIARHEDLRDSKVDLYNQVRWQGRLGIWRVFQQGNRTKYDLVHRDASGVIDHIFYGVSDWGLSSNWQNLLGSYAQQQQADPEHHFDEAEPAEFDSEPLIEPLEPLEPLQPWGERRYRWRNRGAVWRIYTSGDQVLFDLAFKQPGSDEIQDYKDVPANKLKDSWLAMIKVDIPTTGIEVVDVMYDEFGRLFRFRNLRTNEVSDPWREEDLESGTVREYAARMYLRDLPLNEDEIRWWGNIGYVRPMRSQVDLVYRDEFGVDHIFYAARREELEGIWYDLLDQWPDE